MDLEVLDELLNVRCQLLKVINGSRLRLELRKVFEGCREEKDPKILEGGPVAA